MILESTFLRYEALLKSLKKIIISSENRVLLDNPDELFIQNVNFFVKSYLVSICSYLEAYLQEVAYNYANSINLKIKNAKISHNFIQWRLINDLKDKDLEYKNLDLSVNLEDISDNISASPYRTIKLFQKLGIDLVKAEEFASRKDLISTIVNKRNNIIHHNDKAIDISFSDLLKYIEIILEYMKSIEQSVEQES